MITARFNQPFCLDHDFMAAHGNARCQSRIEKAAA
ncbi:Uncharacterised protein [Vibrio cholerae]|nr:Uncharacterised protein [Vibrio cholerae]